MATARMSEDASARRPAVTAGTLVACVFALATSLTVLAVRLERSPIARDPRLLDYLHVAGAGLFVTLSFGALVLAVRFIAPVLTDALARPASSLRLGPELTELTLRSWLEVGAPAFVVGWVMMSGTRAWKPNATVFVLLGVALVGSVVFVWALRRVALVVRPLARSRPIPTLSVSFALALAGAIAWAILTASFGHRYGKSHLVTFGLLVAWLSLVFGEAVQVLGPRGSKRGWAAAWAVGLVGSASAFAASPSASARELFYAERPLRWFGLALARVGPDGDGDGFERPIGFTAGQDCDDADPHRSPLEPEVVGNGVDDNCFAGDQRRAFRELVATPRAVARPSERASNVLVLLLDSVRFDAKSPTGVSSEHSPVLAALARESLVFTDYRTCAPRTLESFGDLFFGRLVPTHRGKAPASAVLRLTAAGVHTVDLSSRFRHEHDRVTGWSEEISIPGRYGEFGDAKTIEATKRVLRRRLPEPFFVAVHLLGAHEPYEPHPACAASAEPYDRYRCAVRLLDERVGDVLRTLAQEGLHDDTVVVVSADHGEEFGEHGARFHAHTVYDEVLRVPLLVRVPNGTAETIRESVGCFDFMPTVLGAANLPPDPLLAGHDFSRAPRPPGRAQFARTRALDARGPFEPTTLSVVVAGTKLVLDRRSGLEQYFDLRGDPDERRPLAGVSSGSEQALKEHMDAWLSELALQSVAEERTASAER